MQRYATTASGLNGTYSSTSISPTTKRTLESLAAAALRRASSIARASRSTPTTARQSGASASATRPEPVPASSTVRSPSGSLLRRSRNAALTSSPESPGRASAGDGAIGCAGNEPRVFRQHAPRIARLRPLDTLETLLDLGGRELHVELALLDVDHDRVAVSERRDRAALGGLGRDVADHETVGRPREAPVGHQGDGVAEAGALERAGHVQHLTHARAALGALPADDDHVVGLDLPGLHGLERVFLALEHAGRAAMEVALLTRDLGHASVGGEIAPEDREPALGLERIGQRPDHLLARRLARGPRFLADRPAGDGRRVAVDEPGLEQPLGDDSHAAGVVHLGSRVVTPGPHVGEERCLARDLVELVDGQLDAGFLGDGEQVQDRV